jgi:hypothetical protein
LIALFGVGLQNANADSGSITLTIYKGGWIIGGSAGGGTRGLSPSGAVLRPARVLERPVAARDPRRQFEVSCRDACQLGPLLALSRHQFRR